MTRKVAHNLHKSGG